MHPVAGNPPRFEGASKIAVSKIVLAGYYGCGNVGDDALLVGLLTALNELPVNAVALSGNPDRTIRNLGVSSIDRRDWPRIEKEIDAADALVFGGGGILQDVTSLFSLKYYTRLIHLAKRKNRKVIMLAQGVGPITSFFGRSAAAAALKVVDEITVRDPQSLQVIRALGLRRPVEVTADLAWLVKPDESPETSYGIGEMKTVGIAARPLGRGGAKAKAISPAFGGFVQLLYKNQYVPVLVEMDRTMDTTILDTIAKLHGGRCPDIRNVETPGSLLARFKRMHSVVAMRLHAGIMAASAGIPPMMIAYDPKVTSFCNIMELNSPMPVDALSADRLWESFKAHERDRDRLLRVVARKREEQTALALRNVDILKRHLPALAAS